jgi:hypothetical protein
LLVVVEGSFDDVTRLVGVGGPPTSSGMERSPPIPRGPGRLEREGLRTRYEVGLVAYRFQVWRARRAGHLSVRPRAQRRSPQSWGRGMRRLPGAEAGAGFQSLARRNLTVPARIGRLAEVGTVTDAEWQDLEDILMTGGAGFIGRPGWNGGS